MELDVENTLIQKIISIRQCRCIKRDMNKFRCGDMKIRNVVHFDDSLLSLMGRTFVPDGIRCWEYFQSKDTINMTIAMYQAWYEHSSLWRYDCSEMLCISTTHCFH
jgi:hypothetical protein